MSALAMLRRQRADETIARDYDGLRGKVMHSVRAQLNRKGIRFDDADLEGFYNQAWQGLYNELIAGKRIDNPGGFLATVAFRRAIDDFRRQRPDEWADDGAIAEAAMAEMGVDVDVAAQLDDHTKLRHFVEGLKDRLTKRECEAATLCYIQGYSRPEAAKLLDVEPRRMEKIMDAVSKKVGVFVRDIEAGEWCQSRRSLLNAYALGVLDRDGERYQLANEHLDECPACRKYVSGVRGLSALLPPVLLPLKIAGSTGAASTLAGLHSLFGGGGGHAAAAASGAAAAKGGGASAAAGATTTAGGTTTATAGGTATAAATTSAGTAITAKVAVAVAVLATAGGGAAAAKKITTAPPKPKPAAVAAAKPRAAAPPTAQPVARTVSTTKPAAKPKSKAAPKQKAKKTRKKAHAARITSATTTTTSTPPAQAPASSPPPTAPAQPAVAKKPSSGRSSGGEFSVEG
jgi:DNA-directed RNA polymerase specialized sigma24 family protein